MNTRNEFIWVLHAQQNVNVIITSEIVLYYSTSFSQSHRAVMIAKITVWIAVPPNIIPPQIPCHVKFYYISVATHWNPSHAKWKILCRGAYTM